MTLEEAANNLRAEVVKGCPAEEEGIIVMTDHKHVYVSYGGNKLAEATIPTDLTFKER
jgi:hypothetical protein